MTRLLDIVNSPWAIQPEKLEEIQGIYLTHLRGEKIDIAALEARLGRPLQNEPKAYEVVDGVAILPLEGVVAKRMNLFSQISGGMSTELAMRNLDQALADPAVHSIIQWIDSPGGTVDGTQATRSASTPSRGKKPIVTLASGVMASAAYWFGAAADKVYISRPHHRRRARSASWPSTSTRPALKRRPASRPPRSRPASTSASRAPTSRSRPKGRQSIQDQVDTVYSVFVADVAKYRGVGEEQVLEGHGRRPCLHRQQAIDAGLVDGVSTLDDLVAS
jgi:ClpP class serine protease